MMLPQVLYAPCVTFSAKEKNPHTRLGALTLLEAQRAPIRMTEVLPYALHDVIQT